ncbi:MAG: response regulator transcription factor [Caldilineaceae bacterium]|nr:response regulator transcription factor [Caldilineaceae bacterium]
MTTQPIRLFIADDHALFREGMRALLSATADIVCVGEAANGEDALRQIEESRPSVVLMDINMPGINGIEATRRILRTHPAAGIIMVTMLEEDASIFAAMRAGARGYVLKGANHQELLAAIRAVAEGQVLFGPTIAARVTQFFTHVAAGQGEESLAELTQREREILDLIARHYTNPEIAQQLGIGDKTIRNHVSNIFSKLQVATRAQAIEKARQAGLGNGGI